MNNGLLKIYKLFGIDRYASELEKSGDIARLEQLNRVLTNTKWL
jgi:hypothetical protein